tara:strand:+ start:232 stop:951 length:720 start_codon:yes stop_codon:yes gene_type:complete
MTSKKKTKSNISRNITTVILCGGMGMRLRPLTNNIPKPLINIKNKPILYYIIKHLKKYQCDDFIIAAGYKSKKICDYMKNNFKSLNYKIIDSGNVDILTRIKDSIKQTSKDIIVCYGDTISNVNIDNLIDFYGNINDKVVISSFPITIPFGVMEIDKKSNVMSFKEKPILREVMNIGYYYIPRNLHKYVLKQKDMLSMLANLTKHKKLRCFKHDGIHITVNTLNELSNAEQNIQGILKS